MDDRLAARKKLLALFDLANLVPLVAGWGMTLKLHWESAGMRWNVEDYAANLFLKKHGFRF